MATNSNFDQNATDGQLVFRTVVPTPKPRVIDMEVRLRERLARAREQKRARPQTSVSPIRAQS